MSVTTATPPGGNARRVPVRLTAACLGVAIAIGGFAFAASPAVADAPAVVSGVILGVGSDASQRIVTWYSSADTAQAVQLAPTASLVNGAFPADAVSFAATGGVNVTTGYNRHATITGLQENTQYSYRVGAEGSWSPAYSFATQSFSGDYDFLFFGDPQIGSSGDEAKDGAGWADTLNVALAANPAAELLVSGGDQVETANTESQWNQFLAPAQLRSVPWVATIGNHDVGGKAYEQHLFTPNTDRTSPYYANGNPASNTSGGDYWFIYKGVLFIDLNSNSYQNTNGTTGDAAHVQYVTNVVNQHGADAKYTVLVYHHSIYSPADHANDADNKLRRLDFPTAFSNLGVDLVLQGHDHSYSRSYEIKNGAKADPNEQPGAADVFQGPGGVVYVTANSASGSKYYDISAPSTTDPNYGPDPLNPASHWANSVQNQEHVRTYVKVEVQSDKLVVENVRSSTCAAPNAAVERGNVSWCGPNSGASPAQPVGSLVDSVTIHPYVAGGQYLSVQVPQGAPGEFGWTVDGNTPLVDLGTATDHNGDYYEATGPLNPITVTDSRRSLAPWSISASVSDFTGADGQTFSGAYLGWTPKVVQDGAGAQASGGVPSAWDGGSGLSVSQGLGWANQGHPKGTAKLGADLDLKIPGTAAQGSYLATLTLTALSS